MTPNQTVAANLRRARLGKGWTQEQAGRALEPYLGEPWSKARWSRAEKAATSGNPRGFTANELVAFALLFDKTVYWFLASDFRRHKDELDEMRERGDGSYSRALAKEVLGIDLADLDVSELLLRLAVVSDERQWLLIQNDVSKAESGREARYILESWLDSIKLASDPAQVAFLEEALHRADAGARTGDF